MQYRKKCSNIKMTTINGSINIHQTVKIILSTLVFLAMKIKKHIQSMYQKNAVKKDMLIYY